MSLTITGRYTPKHPDKYIGDSTRIYYRSSWELEFNKFLDNNANILRWASEEIFVPYIKPTDNKIHKYYPDYYVEYKNKTGQVLKEIIEIKPLVQTQPPKTVGKNKKRQLNEAITYAINVAKWKACQEFCDKQGFKFRIISENKMFLNKNK